jgi:hypothetical protein
VGVQSNSHTQVVNWWVSNRRLEEAVYEVADKGSKQVDKLKAGQRLKRFLIEVGKKTGDVAAGVLQAYIEKQLGL